MRRVLCITLTLVGILLGLTGCATGEKTSQLAICGSFAVPGMLCTDLKGGSYECTVMEEDAQGRVLYMYVAQSVITGKKEKAAVICQRRTSDAVYYYEDVCYLTGEWTRDEIVHLKENNDWNQPLDSSKMTGKSNKTTLDGFAVAIGNLEYKRVKQVCCTEIGIEQAKIAELCFLDTNDTGMELYWLIVNEGVDEKCYFVVSDSSYEITWLEINRIDALQKLIQFKQMCGW